MRRPEILREKLVDQVFGIVLRHADFFEDHGFFAVDIFFGKFRLENHVRKHVEGFGKMLVEHARIEADHFFGGERVEHAADAVHFARDIFRGAPRGALENHVLDEMGNAVQAGRLAARTGAQPDAHGNGMHVLHRLGDNHEAVRQHFLLNRVFCVRHCPVVSHRGMRVRRSHWARRRLGCLRLVLVNAKGRAAITAGTPRRNGGGLRRKITCNFSSGESLPYSLE